MYFEIYKNQKLLKRGKDVIGGISWDWELMDKPQASITLPVEYLDYLAGREEIKVFVNDKVFWGIVTDINVDKAEETIEVDLTHVVHEWEYRQISVNNAIKDKAINVVFKKDEEGKPSQEASVVDQIEDIYNDTNFAYPSWDIDYQGDSGSRTIDYVYSRQSKLEALTQTMELTDDLFWRVDFSGEKRIDIGPFGEVKPYIISMKPSGHTNIRIIEEPTIDYDFEEVINLATVYSEKSDSGMSSMTLREVYNDKSLQVEGFPVLILRSGVNNERPYDMYPVAYQPTKIAPNNELEFAVMDEESVAMENVVIEGTYAFNDLQPFAVDGDKVTDNDRRKAAETAYKATVKKLKQARRSYKVEVTTEELPADLKVGDKVRFIYDNSIYKLEACSNYWKKILTMDDYFYITQISVDIDENEVEIDTVTLEKFIKVDRETQNQQ